MWTLLEYSVMIMLSSFQCFYPNNVRSNQSNSLTTATYHCIVKRTMLDLKNSILPTERFLFGTFWIVHIIFFLFTMQSKVSFEKILQNKHLICVYRLWNLSQLVLQIVDIRYKSKGVDKSGKELTNPSEKICIISWTLENGVCRCYFKGPIPDLWNNESGNAWILNSWSRSKFIPKNVTILHRDELNFKEQFCHIEVPIDKKARCTVHKGVFFCFVFTIYITTN